MGAFYLPGNLDVRTMNATKRDFLCDLSNLIYEIERDAPCDNPAHLQEIVYFVVGNKVVPKPGRVKLS